MEPNAPTPNSGDPTKPHGTDPQRSSSPTLIVSVLAVALVVIVVILIVTL